VSIAGATGLSPSFGTPSRSGSSRCRSATSRLPVRSNQPGRNRRCANQPLLPASPLSLE
jgi:hypothetical protein